MANIRELMGNKAITNEQVRCIHDTIIQPSDELVADMKTYGIHIKPGKSIAFEGICPCESNANYTRKYARQMDIIDNLRINEKIGLYKESRGILSSKRICTLDPEWKKEIIDYVNAEKNGGKP